VKGCTHSSKHLHLSRSKMFGRAPKKTFSFFLHWIISRSISVEPIGRWLHHDAWCKHWRSSSLVENNGVSWGRNAGEHSDSTWPTGVGRNPSLNGRFFHQRAGSSLIKIGKGRIRDLTGDVLFPVAFKAAIPTTIPTVTMMNLGHCWCVMSNEALTGISNCANPPRPWIRALTPRVLVNRISG